MTREDAIAILKDISWQMGSVKRWENIEAIDMAIEALSADAHNDDLIIKGAKGIQDGLYNIKDGKLSKYYAKGGIVQGYEIVPSADDVQGEWVDKEIQCNPYPPIFCVECSACGYRVGRETFLENTFNFCPNCGARMKGGDTE